MNIDSLDPNLFAPASRDAWLKLVNRALKGADFEGALVSRTDDGIAIQPLYARHLDATPLPRRRIDAPWTISQRMDDPDIERAFTQLDADLANGAGGVHLLSKTSSSAFGIGIDAEADRLAAKLAAALSGKDISLRLDGFSPALAGSSKLAGLHAGLDMFTPSQATSELASSFKRLLDAGLAGTILNADGRAIHNAGGTEAQELAVVAASLVAHLRLLEQAGSAPEAILNATSLCLSADQNQFVTMAKARAARMLFARIAEACGISNPPRAHLFMETSYRMLTRLDPETNILRNTIAVFAAGTGGADEISVLPHTLTHGIPDPLARRLARNTQTVLIAESHLDHVIDPAAGAGGIEALTEALAEKAWEIFVGIERDGGLATMIASGRLAAMVAEARASRVAKPIVGTTLFAMKTERPVVVLGALGAVTAGMGLRPVRLDEVGA
ncbi:methylmalonyl-CoA mutase [Agrobacterium rhizogenes]|uniref:methylmalonyl-CoA mutase family protein n=1 Tax=Rhizobium TaxID=379 RepID=UPI00026ECA1C|nr:MULTISPECIES: methylmalonyl-CoA mutase family protein [Rhizobium]OCJ24958.1 methylmalonyl-CoA mutase [Agrobacterium sp. B131/95]OCJ31890.1 methylmalonyl-CoA mutase [Agrobacterium sp. B133/95]EJK80452.1 methylmalonyl-CoA mutase, N-terminal domain/subunit [Rhizobium sp. AP16]MDJ1633012.1 methylmalonyl-CoA mutase family protein [Rhizobium rhizogenes]NTG06537.1 methylmalonyl-CoA mutase [Rhizobium rhizogenes]